VTVRYFFRMPRVVCVTGGYIFSDAQGRLWDGGMVFWMPKVAFGWGGVNFGCPGVFFGRGKCFFIPHGLTGAQRDIDGQRACSVRPSDFLHVHVNKNNLTW